MKKLFKFVMTLILVAAIGVGGFFALKKFGILPNSDANTTTETTTETTTTLYDRPMDATGAAISEEELKALYETANNLYINWVNANGVKADWDTIMTIDGKDYSPVISEGYATIEELKSDLQNYFTEDLYIDFVNENFIMYDNKLYIYSDIIQGDETVCEGAKLTITSSTAEECQFSVSLVYKNTSYTRTYNYKLQAIDGKWKFVNSFDHSISLSKQSHINWK